jgi:purine nucleoside permease
LGWVVRSNVNISQSPLTWVTVINAALSIAALLASPRFDFSKTYFLIAGIGGISPKVGTLGSVVLARYAVQVDLQYELDSREMPTSWSTGYFPQGSHSPKEPPKIIYGTEVYELNSHLRRVASGYGRKASLEDSEAVRKYCIRYCNVADNTFKAATAMPSVIEADVSSSNVFFHGHLLSEAFEQTCKLFTNGAAIYGITAQEDNATLAALLQGAVLKKLDFSRIILMRTASNFDQPPAGELPEIPLQQGHGGFPLAVENIHRVGIEVVRGILDGWENEFEKGIPADNYVGDIFGTLGGIPNFLPPTDV